MNLRIVGSDDLAARERTVLWAIFDAAWADEGFDDTDWDHAFGGAHVLVEDGGEIVAHASVVPRVLHAGGRPLRTGYVEAVATRPDRERRGFGTAAMRAASDLVRDGYELGALGTGSVGFYTRFGWEVWRGPLAVRRRDHDERTPEEEGSVLVLRTPATGTLDPEAPLTCDERTGDVW